ncbi:hypothetical protein [Variovorax sp. J31P207]|uniref:hypothetical protein n=1 Tax=Variovorax sp. J31P207 TaxID=3053510 RepID=UPI00257736A6|nr:hypothetical protein [Variovorax sp. J31P207]MDM0070648.1 hypothetical protein [Variovorax sp. J31P207]
MTTPSAVSIVGLLLGLQLGASGGLERDRLSLEGVSWAPGIGGAAEIGIARLEATSAMLRRGPHEIRVGRVTVQGLRCTLESADGRLRLGVLTAERIEITGLELSGPLQMPSQLEPIADSLRQAGATAPAPEPSAGATLPAWFLGPLAAAEGSIRGHIEDAQLLFDAEVTIPIRAGRVDFRDATVEHVGPDSRMGVSRMGIYVDAPNGRSYVYQFAAAPVSGVEFERRGIPLGPFVSDRGRIDLQPFAETLLSAAAPRAGQGLTEQARTLLGRTSLEGEIRLGDGSVAMPGVRAQLQRASAGDNTVRLRSPKMAASLDLELASLALREAYASFAGLQGQCGTIAGRLRASLQASGAESRFELEIASLELLGLRIEAAPLARGASPASTA